MSLKLGKFLLVLVDAGLVLYWIAVYADLIPKDQAFRDYSNPVVQAWNWSFFPLDLLAAAAGFVGVYLMRQNNRHGRVVLTVGLTLTFCAGFMAITFWSYYGDFNAIWWASNALLMIVPAIVLIGLVTEREPSTSRLDTDHRPDKLLEEKNA